MGFTCNVKFSRDVSTAGPEEVRIINTYGTESLTNAEAGNKIWSFYGNRADSDLFLEDDTINRENTYKSTYESKNALQTCGASAVIFNEENEDNDFYWELKELGSFKVKTGFRVWRNEGEIEPAWKGDAPEVTYFMSDWSEQGVEKAEAEEIIPDNQDKKEDPNHAAALATAAAAALAAFLIV